MTARPREGPVDDDERCRNRLDPALEGGARHGVAAPRGLGTAAASSRGGRFGRLFGDLARRDPGAEAIEVLADRMHVARGTDEVNTRIGAGYTYLGQFVDHDITFDPASRLERDNDPDALVNYRTPRFDLDSLYGSGPADQPFLYDWTRGPYPGAKLLVGRNPPGGELAEHDLPRNAQGRATIGDARNDENVIVAQLHLLFLRFHNKVVERTHESQPWLTRNDLFDEAQRIVRWHYQWIVVHELLERIVGKPMAQAVRPSLVIDRGVVRPTTERKLFAWSGEPAMPVEFSAAAYRFGHSMVRSGYPVAAGGTEVPILPAPGREGDRHLGGFRPLPAALKIDLRQFFGDRPKAFSMKINHRLTEALFSLPPDAAQLARLNLQRGRALGLPSGPDVARAMGQTPLSDDELLPSKHDALHPEFWPPDHRPDERAAILRAPPLWFYLLREADVVSKGVRLGPVGGRIVAEVLVGLLEADPHSYLRQQPAWTPADSAADLGFEAATAGDFTMTDLLAFTLGPGDVQ